MHLVLAPHRRLAAVYGAAFPAVATALAAALAARSAAGNPTRSYDPEAGLPDLGIPPTALAAEPLIVQLEAIADAYRQRGGIIESLWIVGGPQVVPFALLPNPMADSDGPLPVDSLYGLASVAEPLARWPVGRTPDADPPQPGLLARLLERVAAAHRAGPQPAAPIVAVCAERWAAATAAVLELAGVAVAPQTAPPLAAGPAATAALAGARLVYANVHGIRPRTDWFGQPAQRSTLTPALAPADPQRLAGAAIVCQACYGARLGDPQAERSLAVALLAAGADALVAPHVLAYGAPDPPPGESDLLAAHLLAALQVPGRRLGAAVLSAHADLLRTVLRTRGGPGADDLKTLLSFVLYGDPALQWCA
jgi:hypothetical protein